MSLTILSLMRVREIGCWTGPWLFVSVFPESSWHCVFTLRTEYRVNLLLWGEIFPLSRSVCSREHKITSIKDNKCVSRLYRMTTIHDFVKVWLTIQKVQTSIEPIERKPNLSILSLSLSLSLSVSVSLSLSLSLFLFCLSSFSVSLPSLSLSLLPLSRWKLMPSLIQSRSRQLTTEQRTFRFLVQPKTTESWFHSIALRNLLDSHLLQLHCVWLSHKQTISHKQFSISLRCVSV